jgi:shikimate dehydrogenase
MTSINKYAVMGNPIQHSKSPEIHQLFAKQTQQSIEYTRILVSLDGLDEAIARFQQQGGCGLNITLPFKQQAFQLVDRVSERAQLAKAVNTIKFNKDGSRFGDNTDGVGFIRDIKINHQVTIQGKKVLVLGAGGAVRDILGSLLNENPAEVIVSNRTENKAQVLAEEFSALGSISCLPLPSLQRHKFDLIINGTSSSLNDDVVVLPNGILEKDAFCYDLVYGKQTPFLTWAKTQKAKVCADGFGMLVEQAAESFCLWRGILPITTDILTQLK